METKNQEQVQATVVNEQPVENKKSSAGTKVKKVLICTGKVLLIAGLGFLGGTLASKYGLVNKEQYGLAQAQKSFLDRKNGNV